MLTHFSKTEDNSQEAIQKEVAGFLRVIHHLLAIFPFIAVSIALIKSMGFEPQILSSFAHISDIQMFIVGVAVSVPYFTLVIIENIYSKNIH